MSRAKGARSELELFKLLNQHLGTKLQRNLQQSRAGGADAAEDLPLWAIEVKNRAVLSRPAWWRQAVAQAALARREPILFYRRPRERGEALESCWIAVAPADRVRRAYELVPGPPAGAVLTFHDALELLREFR